MTCSKIIWQSKFQEYILELCMTLLCYQLHYTDHVKMLYYHFINYPYVIVLTIFSSVKTPIQLQTIDVYCAV